jgi:hypothetical protein
MSLKAEELSRANIDRHGFDRVIQAELLLIDSKLKDFKAVLGRNVLEHKISLVGVAKGADIAQVQRIVFTAIIRSLESRGFATRIRLDRDPSSPSLLYVAWRVELSRAELAAMDKLVSAHRLTTQDEVTDFLAQEPS